MQFIDLKTQTARIKKNIETRLSRIWDNAYFINGPEVEIFERISSSYLGYSEGIGVASGTDALTITLMALGVGSNTRVFLPAYTYTATAEVICLLGAQPIYVDVHYTNFLLNAAKLDQALATYSKRGDIVMSVDLFGEPCDYDQIALLLKKYEVDLVIDGAQSFGNSYKGAKSIRCAKAFCTSFFPAKPLGCAGDGGAIYTNDMELADICRSIKNHGMGEDKYDIKRIGINGRLDTVQAAILIEKLKIFDEELYNKRALYSFYKRELSDFLLGQNLDYETETAAAQAVFKIRDNLSIENVELQARLKKENIPSMIYYPKTVADQTAYKAKSIESCPLSVSRSLCTRTIALPFHAYLKQEELTRILVAVRNALA